MIHIPRWIGCCLDEGQELHLFSDASEKAVGCCIYVTSHSSQKLLFAKSRVAPLKVQTLARLELQASYLGCRSLKFVCEGMRIEPKTIFAWTDSSTVWHWINKPAYHWVKRVANQVATIQ